jgi:NAD(P)-dependent dehydrogenase (short-subunit alcohol dehydrogenase family)
MDTAFKTTLGSLPAGYRAAVFGASGGIGAAFVDALALDPRCAVVYAGARTGAQRPAAGAGAVADAAPTVRGFRFALQDESSIENAAAQLSADGPLHLVLVTTGLLHDAETRPEKTWRSLSAAALHRAFLVNAIGPALIAKHLLGSLAMHDKAVFAALSARVGSITDNRLGGWHSYRASKAALNMLIRTCAIELAVRNKSAACIALHPGTVDTALSRPFQGGVASGALFTAAQSVGHLLRVIDGVGAAQSGKLFAWDGVEIPF